MKITFFSGADEVDVVQLPAILRGEKGEMGPSGNSAYQVAVDEGFGGTEAEWLASLIGAPGARGEAGPAGESIVGPKGDKGDKGDAGESIIGPKGETGDQGPAGQSLTVTSFTSRAAYDAYTPGPLELAVYTGTT